MAFTGKFFNTTYYLTQNADVAAKWGSSALNHYVTNGAAEGRSPNAWFDYQYYRANNADLATMTALQLFDHYENFGYKEARVTSETYVNFDEANYLATYSDLGANGITAATALNHYLNYGISENRVAKNDNGTVISATTTSTTFRLTEGADSFGGTNGNDYFDASLATTVAGRLMTFGNADSLIGGSGTDTLFVQNNIAAATTVTPVSFAGIEILDLDNSAQTVAAFTIDLQNGDNSITTIKSANNTAAGAHTIVNNVQGVPATINLTNTTKDFTLTNAAAKMTGTSDAATVNLMSVVGSNVVLAPTAAGSGYETINLVSGGSIANTLATIDDGVGTSLATINVTGSQNLTVTLAATATTVTKFDASAFTGVLTFTGVAGSGAQNIIGGTANDVIGMAGTYTAADTINGGTGTDRLGLTSAEATLTAVQSNVSNIETIGIVGAATAGHTYTISNFGATGLRLDGTAAAGALTVNYAAGTGSLDLQTSTGGGALIANIAGTATNDVLNVTSGSTTAGNLYGQTFTINGAETVNLLSQGGANSFASFTMTDTAASQALVITGTQKMTTGVVRADSIDASGMTGTIAQIDLTGGTGTTATAITGSLNADTLIGSTVGDIINGGAGADTIENVVTGTNATAADQLTGGAGFDTFVLRGDSAQAGTAVAAAYALVANISDFTVGSTAATTDIISLSTTAGNYAGGGAFAFHAGIAATTAVAAGSTVIMGVAQNSAAAQGLTASTDLIKLTTGVAPAGTIQAAFNAAIGTATITVGANTNGFVSYYDTTNSKMVLLTVESATAGATTTIGTGDLVTLIGTINMTAADYSAFSNVNLALVVA